MALKACRECKKEVSDSAATCPHCGIKNPVQKSLAYRVILISILALVGFWYVSGGMTNAVQTDIFDKVARDAVAQYEIAKRSGTQMDRCVHAGLVKAAFLQAKKETEFTSWNQIEKTDCAKAGVPR